MHPYSFTIGLAVGAGSILVLMMLLFLLQPWVRAYFPGGALPLSTIIGMRLRGNPPMLLIDAYLTMLKSGERASVDIIEALYIANKSNATDVDTLVRLVREHEQRKKDQT